jgi:hypothetical protein
MNSIGRYVQVGRRCYVRGKVPGEEDDRDGNLPTPTREERESPDCRDTNPGSFHIVITNLIGIHSKGFVAEIDRYNDVWNQPVVAYQSRVLGEDTASSDPGVARRIRVALRMTYGEELKFPGAPAPAGWIHWVSKEPVTGTPHQIFKHKDYEYFLELDASGNIIGGEWITETRPDFLWTKLRMPTFRDGRAPLKGLNHIYRPVRH